MSDTQNQSRFDRLRDFFDKNNSMPALDRLFSNHKSCRGSDDDPFPAAFLYLPQSRFCWLLTECDHDGIAFGLCDLGIGFPEQRSVDLIEIIDTMPDLSVDRAFTATVPISVYTEKARCAGKIVVEQTQDGEPENMPLNDFLNTYREQLLEQVSNQTPVLYNGEHEAWQDNALAGLKRRPFAAQLHRIHACYSGLMNHNLPAVFLNGEMGTGKTMMGICVSALLHKVRPKKPILIISPPHLVYKWRREILDTVPDAAVTVINGSNAVRDLMHFREKLITGQLGAQPHYLIIGRVRMRMGFYWRPAYMKRRYYFNTRYTDGHTEKGFYDAVACPRCGHYQLTKENLPVKANAAWGTNDRETCQHVDESTKRKCGEPLWTMKHRTDNESDETKLRKFLSKLPGIGKVTIQRLFETFGVETLTDIIDDNIYDFVNLIGPDGEFIWTDKHAGRLEKALGRLEFALQMISYQPSEFVKRYFPRKAFGLALIDEAHEYKNADSAQGQAMAVLCSESEKVLCLTGTLMGGYASDLFHLLFRAMPGEMLKMGFSPNRYNSFSTAETRFIHEYGCLIEVCKYRNDGAFSTANARKVSISVKKAPGFSPAGITRFILPYTVFMRLSDLGEGILPNYEEETRIISMDNIMLENYRQLTLSLGNALRAALAARDYSVTSAVINALLRWPETCFTEEKVVHPRSNELLVKVQALFDDGEPTPKEQDIIDVCKAEKQRGRRVIVYTIYTGRFDTASRLKTLLTDAGLKTAVLRSNVAGDAREDWINDQVERGIDVLVCNPELVKTGLDLLAFPTVYFAQTGYNVYTVAQASRRSWRIGQDQNVKVYYACYSESTQRDCYELMAKKIKTALSTMGVMPETGLDAFDEDEDESSVTQALAKSLLGK